MTHFCPVCRRPSCNHLLPTKQSRDAILEALRNKAQNPLDLGVARFAADVVELLG
jgi:hypothetical protein